MAMIWKALTIVVGIIGVLMLIPIGTMLIYKMTGGGVEVPEASFNAMGLQAVLGVALVAGSLLVLLKIDK